MGVLRARHLPSVRLVREWDGRMGTIVRIIKDARLKQRHRAMLAAVSAKLHREGQDRNGQAEAAMSGVFR